jgi:hypothetical protein
MRKYNFNFTIECHSEGTADSAQVERLLDLALQDLLYDENFINALDERQAVTIQLTRST